MASDGDTQYINNMAVKKCAHRRPMHECSDANIHHKVCDQVQHKRVAAEWIASHRLQTEARNAQENEQIRRNGEVDLLAKMATCLPVLDYHPGRPEDIAIRGGPTTTAARKWILWRRCVVTFGGAHSVSWLPMRGTDVCSGLNGPGARYNGMGRARRGPIPPPDAPYVRSITIPLFTNASYTACVAKVTFRNMWLSTGGPWQALVTEWWNTASAADLHHVSCLHIPQSLWDHIPRAWRVDPRERVAWHQYHALHGGCQLRGQLTMPPARPTGAAHAVHSGGGVVHRAAPTSRTTEPHGLCPPQSSRVYRGLGENIAAGWPRLSRGIPPQSGAHMGSAAIVPHQIMGSEISRPVPLFHCRRPRGTARSLGDAISVPALVYASVAVLGASLLDSYRDVLDDLVRQSWHRHSLLRRARVWTTSADRHYQQHNRRVELFSVMSQLWASQRAAHRVKSPLPKRQCCTRPGILGQRPPPDIPLQSYESLSPLRTYGEWHTRDPACLFSPLNSYAL